MRVRAQAPPEVKRIKARRVNKCIQPLGFAAHLGFRTWVAFWRFFIIFLKPKLCEKSLPITFRSG